jgi:hypothetical protein
VITLEIDVDSNPLEFPACPPPSARPPTLPWTGSIRRDSCRPTTSPDVGSISGGRAQRSAPSPSLV